jgi:hypothetical protein
MAHPMKQRGKLGSKEASRSVSKHTGLAAFFCLGESVTQEKEDSARSFRLIHKGPLFVNEYDLL